MPRRVQRFRIRLLPYQFSVIYMPGNFLATADTLSRDPQVSPPVSANVELFVSQVLAALPSTLEVRLDNFKTQQAVDGECANLVEYCARG